MTLLLPLALGADAPPPAQASPGTALLMIFGPLAVFFVVLLLMVRRSSGKQAGYMSKADRHMDRDIEHMANMEAKADRVIALLESIDRKLGDRS